MTDNPASAFVCHGVTDPTPHDVAAASALAAANTYRLAVDADAVYETLRATMPGSAAEACAFRTANAAIEAYRLARYTADVARDSATAYAQASGRRIF